MWVYNDEPVTDDISKKNFGFVYIIENLSNRNEIYSVRNNFRLRK